MHFKLYLKTMKKNPQECAYLDDCNTFRFIWLLKILSFRIGIFFVMITVLEDLMGPCKSFELGLCII